MLPFIYPFIPPTFTELLSILFQILDNVLQIPTQLIQPVYWGFSID